MEALFLKVLNMSIAGGWLILAVIVLRLLLKKAPKWLPCALWAVAAIRLICPFLFESVLSLIPSAETVPPDILYSQQPAIHSGVLAINSTLNPVISGTFAPALGASANPLQIWTAIAWRLWLLGIAAMLIYAAVSYLRLRKRVSASIELRDNIYICDNISTPFVLGAARPRIYIPSDMDEEKQSCVIAHENAHIKRRDNWWKPLGFLLLSVYWFNPLCWLAYILLCRDIELACDEKVIKTMEPKDMITYSEALLLCSAPRRMAAAGPLAFGEVGVKERIKTVLSYKKPAYWMVVAAVAICIAVAVCFLTNPKDGNAEKSDEYTELSVDTFRFSSLVYMNPLGSYRPVDTTGYIYKIGDKSINIIDEETGKLYKSVPINSWSWSQLSPEDWEALFVLVLDDVPDINEIKKPLMLKASDRYYLFNMDGSLWLGEYSGEKYGMWSVYELKPC